MPVHAYFPFGGVSDDTKQQILDSLNQPNEQFGFNEPQIIIAPPIGDAASLAHTYPDHSQVKLSDVVQLELVRGRSNGSNVALFVWAEGSVLQAGDPTAQVIYAEVPSSEETPPNVEQIRAELGEVAAIINCVESGNQSFGECQEWAGSDGVVRRERASQENTNDTPVAPISAPPEEPTRMMLQTKAPQ